MLFDASIAKKYPGFKEGVIDINSKLALESFSLKKFFYLVWFLDQLKLKNLFGNQICLFLLDSTVKSSADVLQIFAKV